MSNFPVPPAVPEESKGPNGLYLYARVFDEPTMVFKEITRRPRVAAPLLIFVLVACLRAFLIPDAILRKQAEIGFDAVEKIRPGTITQDLRDQTLSKVTAIGARARSAAFGSLGIVFGTMLAALVLWGVFAMAGAENTFKGEYSLLLYGAAPALLGNVVLLALLPVTQSATFSPGLQFAISADTSPFLHLFLAGITLFSVWMIYLLSLAHQVQRKAKSITGSLMVIGIIWLCLSIAGALFGASFGGANLV